jgi:hypothetical protein
MSRSLILAGLALLALGLAWPWISRLPLGRLPGDLHWQRDGMQFYFPLGTCLALSVIASLIGWWLRR